MTFGTNDPADLIRASTNIRTFTEPLEPAHDRDGIVEAIKASKAIIFLGSGFGRPNMELMQVPEDYAGSNGKAFFATVFGIDINNFLSLTGDIIKLARSYTPAPDPLLLPLRSVDLMDRLRPTIAARTS